DSVPGANVERRTREGMLRGGESGAALAPGSAGKSLLLEMVRKGEMPPKGEKLKAAEVAVLRAWIDAGAPAARPARADAAPLKVTEEDRRYWAFRKPVRPPVPAVRATSLASTPTDHFILPNLA